MKDRKQYLIIGAMLAILITYGAGCSMLGGKTPPNAFEQRVFDTETNLVPSIVEVARTIQETQARTNLVTITNEVNRVITVTNIVIQPVSVTKMVTETNYVEAYTHTVKDETKADAQMIGGIANLISPGSGGLIAGLMTGVLGAWARMRSHKKTGTVLAGNIQAIRSFIKTSVPNGIQYDQALVKWMSDNQTTTGTIDGVLDILKRHVTNKDAREGATEIQALLDELKKQA